MWLGICLYGVGALFWTACALVYGLGSWRGSWVGWSLLGSWSSFAAVLILAVVLPLTSWPRDVDLGLAVGVLSAIDLAGLLQLVTVLRIQRDEGVKR